MALLVKKGNASVLFDTGNGPAIFRSLEQFGIQDTEITTVFISHGHARHGGNLLELARRIPGLRVYAHPNIFQRKYIRTLGEKLFIGFPFDREDLLNSGAQLHLTQRPYRINDTFLTTGEIHRNTEYETIEENFRIQVLESFITDELRDDMGLVVKQEDGISVISGCAHAGVINTVRQAMRLSETQQVRAIAGGFHLRSTDDERMRLTLHALEEINPQVILPMHCTGPGAIRLLQEHFPGRVRILNPGDEFEL